MVFPILVLVGTLISAFGGVSAKKTSRKEDLQEDNESILDIEDAIRREIHRKKEARTKSDPHRLEQEEEAPVLNQESFRDEAFDAPSQFQVHLDEQASQLKAKQAEAKRLKENLEQSIKGQLNEASIQSRTIVDNSAKVSKKIRALLTNKQKIKTALVAGEILAQPLALRTDGSARSTRF